MGYREVKLVDSDVLWSSNDDLSALCVLRRQTAYHWGRLLDRANGDIEYRPVCQMHAIIVDGKVQQISSYRWCRPLALAVVMVAMQQLLKIFASAKALRAGEAWKSSYTRWPGRHKLGSRPE